VDKRLPESSRSSGKFEMESQTVTLVMIYREQFNTSGYCQWEINPTDSDMRVPYNSWDRNAVELGACRCKLVYEVNVPRPVANRSLSNLRSRFSRPS
jgi:hypothetical protein